MRLQIGLTGGIGSGKSTVAQLFKQLGAFVIDSDKIAREVVEPGTSGLKSVVKAFGKGVLDSRGNIDRKSLGKIVFADSAKLKKLNSIMHPLIRARSENILDSTPQDAVILHDIPLLVENNLYNNFHLNILVEAAKDLKIQRLVAARKMSITDIESRILAQATDEIRAKKVNVVLNNDATEEDLAKKIKDLWDGRINFFRKNLQLRFAGENGEQISRINNQLDDPKDISLLKAKLEAFFPVAEVLILVNKLQLILNNPVDISEVKAKLIRIGFIAEDVKDNFTYYFADPVNSTKLSLLENLN